MKIYEIRDENNNTVIRANASSKKDLDKITKFFGKSLDMINYDLAKYKHIKKDKEKYTLAVMFIDFSDN
jgi:hypothetical protein